MTQGRAERFDAVSDRLDFWEKHERRFLTLMPYVCLVLCAVADPALNHGFRSGVLLRLAIAAAALAVMIAMDLRWQRTEMARWDASHVPARVAFPVFGFQAATSLALVVSDPTYGFYAWTGYLWAWRLLPGRLRLAGVACMALPVAVSQTGSGPYRDAGSIAALVGVYLINLLVAGGLGWFGWVGSELQERRAHEVDALTETNARLNEANARLAELQEQLVDRARERGVADERRRMAREIHDTLAQGLMGIITQLQVAQRAGLDAPDAATHVDAAISLARESLTEARRSVNALAPEPLVQSRLPEAIQGVAQRWSELHGVPAAFTTTGNARPVTPEVEVVLLRTAQEALANVAKHADAGRVGLTLSYMDDLVTLDVRDDGRGFEPAKCPRQNGDGGFGLAAMRERIEGVAGSLAIESDLQTGTAISAAVPVMSR